TSTRRSRSPSAAPRPSHGRIRPRQAVLNPLADQRGGCGGGCCAAGGGAGGVPLVGDGALPGAAGGPPAPGGGCSTGAAAPCPAGGAGEVVPALPVTASRTAR